MPDAFGPLDQNVLADFRRSDERAFETIVRSGFPSLVSAATAEAGDETAAARVVESAFVHAWEEREKFDTPEALEAFLRDCIHRGALREKSRRAALHRFEEREHVNVLPRSADGHPLTADEIWQRVNTVLHTPRPSQESTARVRHDVSRHEAAAHVAQIAKQPQTTTSLPMMAAIALVVVAAIAALAYFLNPGSADLRLESALASSDVRVRSTGPGQRAAVELTDQTRVRLGSASRLVIPSSFGEGVRGVGLEGAASFDVPAGDRAFIVRAGTAHVRVVGTKFDVSAFPTDERIVVRVREGQVEVVSAETARTLRAGSAVAINGNGTVATLAPADVEQSLAWADDQFVVVDRPLREVVPLLNRWYALELNVADDRLLDRKATIRAPLSSSRKAIEELERTAGVKFGYDDRDQRVLRDAAAADAKRKT